MFDMSWSELLIIGGVALVVIGPKDMPYVVRSVAGFVRKARNIASEFQQSLTDIADQSDLKELRKQLVRETDDVRTQLNMAEHESMMHDAGQQVGAVIANAYAVPSEATPESPTPEVQTPAFAENSVPEMPQSETKKPA